MFLLWRFKLDFTSSRSTTEICDCITKTCLYNFDPLKLQFYIVKLGYAGIYIIFHISSQNIDCGYLLEPPRRGGSNEYPQSMFWPEIWKISKFFIWKFSVFGGEIFIYLNRHVFVMEALPELHFFCCNFTPFTATLGSVLDFLGASLLYKWWSRNWIMHAKHEITPISFVQVMQS